MQNDAKRRLSTEEVEDAKDSIARDMCEAIEKLDFITQRKVVTSVLTPHQVNYLKTVVKQLGQIYDLIG